MTRASLFTQHRPLARRIARGWRINGMSPDDIEQEAMISLWQATKAFDPAKGRFPAFARLVIERRLIDLHKSFTAHDRRIIRFGRDLAIPFGDPDQTKQRLDEIMEGMGVLSDSERRAITDHLNGVPAVSSKQHNNALTRARRKLRLLPC